MRRARWGEVESLVNGRPHVGWLGVGLLKLIPPPANLYVSKDCLVLQLRFGLARLYRTWAIDRREVTYVEAGAVDPGSVGKETVRIVLESKAVLTFWTWRSWDIADDLRDLGYPCRPHEGPGSLSEGEVPA
jgi:hypothetical protein